MELLIKTIAGRDKLTPILEEVEQLEVALDIASKNMTETPNLTANQNQLQALLVEVAKCYAKRNSYSSSFGSDGNTRTVNIEIRDDSFSHKAVREGEISITARGTLEVKYDSYLNDEGEWFRSKTVYEAKFALTLFRAEEAAAGFRVDDAGEVEVFTGRVETVPEGTIHWIVQKNDPFDMLSREPQVLDSSFHALAGKYPAAVFVLNRVKELSHWQDDRYV